MKTILKSLAAIVAVGAIAGGATFAYFSDEETITGNSFTAGTVDLKIDSNPDSTIQWWHDGFANTHGITNLAPGDTDSQIIDIKNVGSIDSEVTFDMNRTSNWSDLAGALEFHVYFDAKNDGGWDDTNLHGTVDEFTQAYNLGLIESETGIASVKIEWTLPASTGNDAQGDNVTIDALFGLMQEK